MLKSESEYSQKAKETVELFAGHWLSTVENWSPIIGNGISKIADMRFVGSYKVVSKKDATYVAGRCSPTCSGKAEASRNINLFIENWVEYPNQTQREKIFQAIRDNHTQLTPSTPEITRASEQWQETCGTCGGDGSNPCHRCGASGKIRCRTCSGLAKVRCSVCFGHRGKYVPGPNHSSTWYSCAACSGAGDQRCRSCDFAGRETCPTCPGNGRLPCSPCGASGAFSHTLTGYINLRTGHEVTIAPVDETFDALAEDVYTHGCLGKLPDFNPGAQIEWADNLVVNEVSTGVYQGDFDGKLPFYFVDMKPDERFGGTETTTIFTGKHFYPLSLGYIFDTTVHKLVDHGSRDINTGKEDIRKWTASRLGNSVHEKVLEGSGKTILEQISGISSNARDILVKGFEELTEQFREPAKSMNLGQLVKKTISFSARGYFICMALGMLTLILSTSNGHPYAVNWDIVGFSSTMQTMVSLVLATVTGDIFRDPDLFTGMVIVALVLLGLIKAFLVGPKPWSKTKLFFVFLLTYVVGGAVVVVVTMFLPYEAYYVFPDDYTVGFLSMTFSELLGVVSMIPEIIMVSAIVAYLRIRKSQDDDVAKALDEIESPTLKRQLGFAKS